MYRRESRYPSEWRVPHNYGGNAFRSDLPLPPSAAPAAEEAPTEEEYKETVAESQNPSLPVLPHRPSSLLSSIGTEELLLLGLILLTSSSDVHDDTPLLLLLLLLL